VPIGLRARMAARAGLPDRWSVGLSDLIKFRNDNHSHSRLCLINLYRQQQKGHPSMNQFALAIALSVAMAVPATVWAKADCKANPKAEWMNEADAKAKLEAQGYKIAKFKIDGNCYEIYGTNKDGKKVEIYFDTKSLDVVKAEIEK